MKVWLIWLQEDTAGYTWLEAAWTDDQTAEDHEGWQAEVDRCKKLAYEESAEIRIQAVNVPGVFDLFNIPEVNADV